MFYRKEKKINILTIFLISYKSEIIFLKNKLLTNILNAPLTLTCSLLFVPSLLEDWVELVKWMIRISHRHRKLFEFYTKRFKVSWGIEDFRLKYNYQVSVAQEGWLSLLLLDLNFSAPI